jgi:hypothetical protein
LAFLFGKIFNLSFWVLRKRRTKKSIPNTCLTLKNESKYHDSKKDLLGLFSIVLGSFFGGLKIEKKNRHANDIKINFYKMLHHSI